MSKFLVVIKWLFYVLVACSLVYGFCVHGVSDSVRDFKFGNIVPENFYIFTDPDTGVQYIVYRQKAGYAGFGGITPRLNSDGSLIVID